MRKLDLLTIGTVERTALAAFASAILWLGVAWALA